MHRNKEKRFKITATEIFARSVILSIHPPTLAPFPPVLILMSSPLMSYFLSFYPILSLPPYLSPFNHFLPFFFLLFPFSCFPSTFPPLSFYFFSSPYLSSPHSLLPLFLSSCLDGVFWQPSRGQVAAAGGACYWVNACVRGWCTWNKQRGKLRCVQPSILLILLLCCVVLFYHVLSCDVITEEKRNEVQRKKNEWRIWGEEMKRTQSINSRCIKWMQYKLIFFFLSRAQADVCVAIFKNRQRARYCIVSKCIA